MLRLTGPTSTGQIVVAALPLYLEQGLNARIDLGFRVAQVAADFDGVRWQAEVASPAHGANGDVEPSATSVMVSRRSLCFMVVSRSVAVGGRSPSLGRRRGARPSSERRSWIATVS